MQLTDCKELCQYIREGKVDEITAFFRRHEVTDFQDTEENEGLWLNFAIEYGPPSTLETLLRLGLDPNPEVGDFDSLPLTVALNECDDHAVQLLLESGADPDPERHLISAINSSGDPVQQLRYVKWLVEHGADVNQRYELAHTDKFFTALDWAQSSEEVRDYLISVGAKTEAELAALGEGGQTESKSSVGDQPPKGPERHLQEVIGYFTAEFGEPSENVYSSTLSLGGGVKVHRINPTVAGEPTTLFTVGLSARPMPVPADAIQDAGYAELYLQLPPDWNLDREDRQVSWPIDFLLQMAEFLISSGACLLPPVTCIENGEPVKRLGPNVPFTSTALLALSTFKRSDGNLLNGYCLMPIHADEHEMIKREGVPPFLHALDAHRVSKVWQPDRKSLAQ